MSDFFKRIITLFLSVILIFSVFPLGFSGVVAGAVSFDDLNDEEVFLKQQTSITCTLSSAAMMMRRTAIIAGFSDWREITEESIRETAWIEGLGLRWDYTYFDMTIGHGYYPEGSDHKLFMIDLLERYPQGVVVYNTGNEGQSHAVFLCDYDENEDIFYVADPASGVSLGRIPLTESTIVGETQEEQLNNLSAFWYVSTPEITLNDGVYTSSGTISNPYDPTLDTEYFDTSKKAVHKYFVVNYDSSRGVAVRNYPSGSSSVAKYVTKGTILYVTYVGQNFFGADWYKLNTGNYIFNTNLIPFDEYSDEVIKFNNTCNEISGTYKAASASGSVAIRLEPSEGNNTVATVKNDTQLYITHSGVNSVGAAWLRTQEGHYVRASEMKHVSDKKLSGSDFSGSYGLVMGEYLSTPVEDSIITPEPPTEPENYRITASALNLRETPVDGRVLVSIPQNTIVEVTSITDGWGKTEYNGHTGWISMSYTEKAVDLPTFRIESVKISDNTLETGETVTCTITVANGLRCMYKFYVCNDSGEKVYEAPSYATKNVYEYRTDMPGNYYFKIDVKSIDERVLSAFSGNFSVHDKLQLGALKSNIDEYTYINEPVTWTCETLSDSKDAVYTYSLYCNDELVLETESRSHEFSYTPETAGSYVLFAVLADSHSVSDVVKADEVIVYDMLSVDEIIIPEDVTLVGKTVDFSAVVSGGTGEYQYCFTIFRQGTIIHNGVFTGENSGSYVFNGEGTYRIFCAVKDSGNMIVSAFSKDFQVISFVPGDVDGDGTVTAKDSRSVLRHSARIEYLEESSLPAADVNSDGVINAADARKILRAAARIETL